MAYLLALTILLIPTYALRFDVFGLPTNLLMMWVVIFWLIFIEWLIKKRGLKEFLSHIKALNKKTLLFIGLFFLAGIISLFTGGFSAAKLGQFVVLFLQPISLFFIAKYILEKIPSSKNLLLNTVYLLLGLAGAYAIFQYFTLIGLPEHYWGNSVEPKRAMSFFSHPNFYALFSAPLLALLLPDAVESLKSKVSRLLTSERSDGGQVYLKSLAWIIGAVGLLLSMSRAGWLGLLVAMVVYLIAAADKKTRLAFFGLAIIGIISVFSIANLRYRIILPLLERSLLFPE